MEHKALRKYRGPETWALVRDAYLSGVPGPVVAARFDVGLANLRKKSREEGWSRRHHAAATDLRASAATRPSPPAAPPSPGAPDEAPPPTTPPTADPVEAIESAKAQAAAALAAGDPLRASALVKAAQALAELTGVSVEDEGDWDEDGYDAAQDDPLAYGRFEMRFSEEIWKRIRQATEVMIADKPGGSLPCHLSHNVFAWRAANLGREAAAADYAHAVNRGWACHFWDAHGRLLPPPDPEALNPQMEAQHKGLLWWRVEHHEKEVERCKREGIPPPPGPPSGMVWSPTGSWWRDADEQPFEGVGVA